MHEKIVDVPTADGRMETFIVHPQEGGAFAPVVVYMDVWGLREELYDIARKIAVVGYYVMLPDLYYRQGRVRHQWRDAQGRMISMHNLDPERQAQVRAPLQQLSDAMVVADSGALLAFVERGEPVQPGPVGSTGYCMGGRHVICVSAAHPERFVAAASLHGTQLATERQGSPHRLAPRLRGELYCGFAEKDPNGSIGLDIPKRHSYIRFQGDSRCPARFWTNHASATNRPLTTTSKRSSGRTGASARIAVSMTARGC